jgi:hypothetical protein
VQCATGQLFLHNSVDGIIHIHKHKMCRVVDTLYTQVEQLRCGCGKRCTTFDGDRRSKLCAHGPGQRRARGEKFQCLNGEEEEDV